MYPAATKPRTRIGIKTRLKMWKLFTADSKITGIRVASIQHTTRKCIGSVQFADDIGQQIQSFYVFCADATRFLLLRRRPSYFVSSRAIDNRAAERKIRLYRASKVALLPSFRSGALHSFVGLAKDNTGCWWPVCWSVLTISENRSPIRGP